MLTHAGLKRDVTKRIERVQAMMRERELGALVVIGQAMPGGMGALRYISNAHLWGGAGYAVLGSEDPDPWLEIWSSYQAVWTRNETTSRSVSPGSCWHPWWGGPFPWVDWFSRHF